jgi:hypothetical protein
VFFHRTDGIEEIPFGGGRIALYRSDMEKAVVLNRVGSLLWKQLERPQSNAMLVAHLTAAFPATERERLEHDVLDYLELLQSKGIIALVKE